LAPADAMQRRSMPRRLAQLDEQTIFAPLIAFRTL
jgi:hypothetical protein